MKTPNTKNNLNKISSFRPTDSVLCLNGQRNSEKATSQDIRIAIFNSDDQLNESISQLLGNTEEVSLEGVFNDGHRLIQNIRDIQPHVVLMDVKLPDICPLEAVKLIRNTFPAIKTLMLATSDEDDIVLDAICAGALGCILKVDGLENISETIVKLQQGQTIVSPFVLRRMTELLHRTNVPKRMSQYNLTTREMEVMNHIIEGASYKMVGDRLGICYNTVHNHIRSIYKKLEVNSMSEAVSKVLSAQMNWLSKVAGSFLLPLFLWDPGYNFCSLV